MSDLTLPPGWYGKLPSLGDFASRRLDTALIEAWDAWLAAGMLSLRSADPAGWLDAYLVSPRWRFLLMPGVLPGAAGEQGWAGVLMPSVDRVGRYFPFTLLQPLGELPASTQQMAMLWGWLERLDELAADALHDDWTVERLEDELARMQGPGLVALSTEGAGPAPRSPGEVRAVSRACETDAARHIGIEAQRVWRAGVSGVGYWSAGATVADMPLLISRGLPGDAACVLGLRSSAPPGSTVAPPQS